MILIGFAGPMGSGKTTAAEMIRGAKVMSFAAPLKRGVAEIFGFTDNQLYTLDGKNSVDSYWGVSPREMLQFIGTDCLRKRFPKFWVRRMELELKTIRSEIVVIDDIRFEDEAELVRSLGGTVVHINGRRAEVEGDIAEHRSEKGIEIRYSDVVLDNSNSIEDLRRVVGRLVEYVRQ